MAGYSIYIPGDTNPIYLEQVSESEAAMISGNPPKQVDNKPQHSDKNTPGPTHGWLTCCPRVASPCTVFTEDEYEFVRCDLFRFRLQLSEITMADGNQRTKHRGEERTYTTQAGEDSLS